jgi:hypothetical protein
MTRAGKQQEKGAEPDPPKRRNRIAAIGLDACPLGRAAFESAGFAEPGLVLRWGEIVGPEVARFACPLRLTSGPSGGTLTLMADSGAAVFLQHESRLLCNRINTYLGRTAVQRLRFVPGRTMPQLRDSQHRVSVSDVLPQDPVRRFAGPDRLRAALLALARTRAGSGAAPND